MSLQIPYGGRVAAGHVMWWVVERGKWHGDACSGMLEGDRRSDGSQWRMGGRMMTPEPWLASLPGARVRQRPPDRAYLSAFPHKDPPDRDQIRASLSATGSVRSISKIRHQCYSTSNSSVLGCHLQYIYAPYCTYGTHRPTIRASSSP
jgi:hypothetical protein